MPALEDRRHAERWLAAEPEPAEDFEGLVRALNAAARAVDRLRRMPRRPYAVPGAGSRAPLRASMPKRVRRRRRPASQASRSEPTGLATDVPVRAGREAYADLVVLMDAAQRRARAACSSIEQPR